MYKDIEKMLIEDIGASRFEHSLRVVEVAKKLGSLYGGDMDKIILAALLHDCGKLLDMDDQLKNQKDFGIILKETMIHSPQLIHGPLGAKLAEEKYRIKDKEILEAIYYHTTGKENMSLVGKIVYIADYIEPNRSFCGLDKVRELAYINIDKSLLLAIDQTIAFLIKKDKPIDLDTIKARNYLLIRGGVN